MRLQHFSSADGRAKRLSPKFILGAALALGLTATAFAPTAKAANIRLGTVDVQIDTTVSAGVSVRVEDRENRLLSAANGGPQDNSPGLNLSATTNGQTGSNLKTYGPTVKEQFVAALGASGVACATQRNANSCQYDTNDQNYNYDTGLNGDDGRLNFDNGDLTSGTVKFTTDFEASMGNFRGFLRLQGFYDAVLASDSSFERSSLNDQADRDAVENINVLDAYLDYYADIAGNPVQVRLGRQVVNWGESTFFLGGNSVFSPIDVPAIRRPGAEIKDALLPVEALYGSIALPYDLTLEAYVGGWDHYKLDVGGTALATSDAANVGSEGNGNRFWIGTSPVSGNRRNCDAASSTAVGVYAPVGALTGVIGTALEGILEDCADGALNSHTRAIKEGQSEIERTSSAWDIVRKDGNGRLGDSDFMSRGADVYDDKFDDYGLALRWYSEALNSTEFGFYYQNYTSRVPYVSSAAKAPTLGLGTTGTRDGAFTRQFGIAGCLSQDLSAAAIAADPASNVKFEDPLGLAPVFASVFNQTVSFGGSDIPRFSQIKAIEAASPAGDDAGTGLSSFAGASVAANPTTLGQLAPIGCAAIQGQMALSALAQSLNANCADLTLATFVANANKPQYAGCAVNTSGGVASGAIAAGGLYLPTGAVTPVLRYGGSIFLEYPDDIEVWGWSFATTIAGWGVQGEIAHRDNMPLQQDTDMVTISAIAGSCAWENFNGVKGLLYGQQLTPTRCGDYGTYHGWVEEKVTHYDIGTTATFTRSNPVINFLGADLGILLTEFQLIDVPNADQYARDYRAAQKTDTVSDTLQLIGDVAANREVRLATRCTSGSDLPLGGVLSLDPRKPSECRPTEQSSGGLVLFQLQYNNAFGTAWAVRPQLVYRVGLDGMSPTPAGSWIEDQSVTGLSVEFEKQSRLRARLGYTIYEGDVLYNQLIDRDSVDFSVSYAF